jgi:hypothetical protein
LLIFYKKIQSKDERVFFLYALLTAILVFFVILFRYIYTDKISYFLIARIHTIIEFSLLSYLFSLFLKNKIAKKLITLSVLPFFIICLSDYFLSKVPSIAYVPLLIECLFFMVVIIYFFFEKMKQEANEPLFQTFIFWFAVAFLINFSGNFLLFVYSETSVKDVDFKVNYTFIYSTVTILKNLLLCISVIIKEKSNNNSTDTNKFSPSNDPLFFNPDKRDSLLT